MFHLAHVRGFMNQKVDKFSSLALALAGPGCEDEADERVVIFMTYRTKIFCCSYTMA